MQNKLDFEPNMLKVQYYNLILRKIFVNSGADDDDEVLEVET